MTSKISIKITNHFGVNSIKGEDISKEETLELIGLARDLISQTAPTPLFSSANLLEEEALNAMTAELSTAPLTVVSPSTVTRPAPVVAKKAEMEADDTPIKLGSKPSATPIKRIVPREPYVEPEAPKVDPIEPNQLVFKTPGSEPINTLADKLVSTFQTSQGIEPPSAPATELLTLEEQIVELNMNYFSTGIKYKIYAGEITPMYRVRCECPSCGNKGNQYVLETRRDIACIECRTSLRVEQAAGKFPERDEWGNFFVANTINPKFQRA